MMGAIQNLAKLIPAEGEADLLELVCRIEKLRALQDDESRLVEQLVKKERRRKAVRVQRVWTHTQKTALLNASKLRGGVKKFALENGMPDRTAWHMLRHLRNGMTKKPKVKG
jgi:hypothetical protein